METHPRPDRRRTRSPFRTAAVSAAAAALVAGGVWVALPASAATTTFQAEAATLSGGATVATDHTGYTGSGFVAGYTDGNKGNAATTFAVDALTAGSATVTARYANATTATMSLSLYLNGAKVRQITFAPLATWDTWATSAETLTLRAGDNTIAYRFDSTDSGNINLDSVTVAGGRVGQHQRHRDRARPGVPVAERGGVRPAR